MAKVERDAGALVAKKKSKPKDDGGGYELPTRKTKPVATLLGYILLLFGEKKIGKTTLLAEGGDETFFAFFEPGGKALSLYGDQFGDSWIRFKLAVKKLTTEQPRRFNHVVIDTVDMAYKTSVKYTLKKLDIEHQSDEGYGKGWAASRDDFELPIMQLVNAGIAVTFISHADEREVKLRDGTAYDKLSPTMPKQPRELIEGLVDIWAYYGYDGKRRVLVIQGDDHIAAGHRLSEHFKTLEGKRIREIDMGSSPAEAYKNFNDAFHNRYIPPAKKREEDSETKKVAFKKKVKKVAA